jgi:phosphoribosyl 1,2-cyclic phosphodiesterase
MIKFCSLFSGSSGNCIFIGTDEVKILIDAGVSGSKIAGALGEIGENPEDLSAIFVTHEHSDHVSGVGIVSRRYNVPIYATDKTWQAMSRGLGKILPENRRILEAGSRIAFGDVEIRNFSIPHDAADPVAYSFQTGGKKVSVATDMGCITQEVRENITGSDLILLESNHDVEMLQNGSYPYVLKQRILGDRGHLSNIVAADFLTELALNGTTQFFLGHLSQENNTPECAYETTCHMLLERELKAGRDLDLWVADRYHYSRVVNL